MATKKTNADATLTPKMQQAMKGLCEPFPPDKIETRQGRAGQTWSFVASSEVINRLNEVFGCSWSVTEVESLVINNFVVKRVRLEVPDVDNPGRTSVREGWGGNAIGNDPGDCMKSAFSKALTKAASLFGVGLHLWGVSSENIAGTDEGPPWEGTDQFAGQVAPPMNVTVVNPGPHNAPPVMVAPPPQMVNPNAGMNQNVQPMPPQGPPVQQQSPGPVPQMSNPNVGFTSGPGTPATTQVQFQGMPQPSPPPPGQFASQQQMAPPMGQMQQVTGGGIVAHQVAAVRGATTMAYGPNSDPMMLVRQVLGAEAQNLQAVEELTYDQAVRVLGYIRQNFQGVQ
jgi:hypothetical protein